MKIVLDGMEIEIKVKKADATKSNTADTEKFINELMTLYSDSATYAKTQGFDFLYEKRMNRAVEIYTQLKEANKLTKI